MTIGEWKRAGGADAVWILEEVLRLPRGRVFLESNRILKEGELSRLNAAKARREAGEPVQYIFRRAPFMGYEFYVDPRVLIPRMDTEVLCEAAAQFLEGRKSVAVLDLCAGSGAIGLSLKRINPEIRLTLSDVSADAGDVQRINTAGLDAEILTGDLFMPVAGRLFDLIAVNPPYIRAGEIPALSPEVRKEPMLALDGGADGLDFYRRIAREFRVFLAPGGRLYLEVGYDQADDVTRLLGGGNVICDLSGTRRVVWTEV
jgi:release factor glutamine methyltransferase